MCAAKVKLYDLRKKNYPDHVEFRTLQVHTCPTCSSRTNNATNTGWPGTCLFPHCPNILKEWHNTVGELKNALEKVKSIQSAKLVLETEIEKILNIHLNEITDDICGNADRSLTW